MTTRLLQRSHQTLVATERGQGPAVLLLHAGGERRQVWDRTAMTLADHGLRPIAYDLRGHGASSSLHAGALGTHAADVVAMLAEEPAPVTVVGASLGGLAALQALGTPQARARIHRLVLVDVVPNMDGGRVRRFLAGLDRDLQNHPVALDILGRRAELCASARELQGLPTLLVRAGRGPLTDADVSGFLDLMPDARVAVIPNAGHLVARDAPTDLAALILEHERERR
jgi:pimeloyl-ACP methyl ester carboxylesterase